MAKKVINAFNVGEVSPYVHARTDNELYDSACLKMENFLPLEYGGATRRPALKFLESSKSKVILIPFIETTDSTFLLEFKEKTLTIIDSEGNLQTSFTTDFLEEELYQIRYVQLNKKIFFTHPNHNIYELIKIEGGFEFNYLEFKHPPLLEINNSEISIKTSAHTGITTLTSSTDFFEQDHEDSYMVFRTPRTFTNDATPASNSSSVKHYAYSNSLPVNGVSDSILAADSNFRVETTGIWDGKVILQRSFNNKEFVDYIVIGDTTGSEDDSGDQKNFTFASTEEEPDNSYLRTKFIGGTDAHSHATGCTASIIIDNPYHYATVKILEYTDAKNVIAEVVSDFQYDINDFDENFDTALSTKTFNEGDRIFSSVALDDAPVSDNNTTVDITSTSLVKTDASGSDLSSQWATLTTVVDIANPDVTTYKESQIVDWTFGNNKIWILDKSAQVHTLSFNTTTSHEFDYNGIAFNVQSDFKSLDLFDMSIMTTTQDRYSNATTGGRFYNDNFETRKRVHGISYDNTNSTYPIAILGGKDTRTTSSVSRRNWEPAADALYSSTTNQQRLNNSIDTGSSNRPVTLDINAYCVAKVHFYNESGDKKPYVSDSQYSARWVSRGVKKIEDHIEIYPTLWDGDGWYQETRSWIVPRCVNFQNNHLTIHYIDYKLNRYNGGGNLRHRVQNWRFSSENDNTGERTGNSERNYQTFDDPNKDYNVYRAAFNNAKRDAVYKLIPHSISPVPSNGFKIRQAYSSYIFDDNRIEHRDIYHSNSSAKLEYNTTDNLISNTAFYTMFSTETDLYALRSDMVLFKLNLGESSGASNVNYPDREPQSYFYVKKTFQKDSNTILALEEAGTIIRENPLMKDWYEGAFSKKNGYPTDLAFYENRLVFAGSTKEPNTIHLSRTDDFNNFTLGTTATHAMRLTINSGSQNPIKWIVGAREINIGTDSNEWTLSSGSPSQAITPTQFGFKRRSQYGASNTNAVFVNSAVLFMMRQNKKIREWYLQDNQEDYLAQDLAFIAEHITGDGIKQIAVQTQPTTVVWMVREDGELIGLTYERESKTVAWHRQKFDGFVESVAVLPKRNSEDEVFVSVKLNTNFISDTNTTVHQPTVTETFPDAVTKFEKTAHGYSTGDFVRLTNFYTTSSLYESSYNNALYEVHRIDDDNFNLLDVSGNKIPSLAFNLSAAAFTNSSPAIGNYVLLSGDGTIDDSTTKWVHVETYLREKSTGQYYYFDIRDGKWNFGIYTNYSMAQSTDSTQSKYVWDVDDWGDGIVSSSPFNNDNWNGGSATGNIQNSSALVVDPNEDLEEENHIVGKFNKLDWGTDLDKDYRGLDFYKEYSSDTGLDMDFSTVPNGIYKQNGTYGDWRFTGLSIYDPNTQTYTPTGGFIVVDRNIIRIHGTPDTEPSSAKIDNALIQGQKYKITYTVENTEVNNLLIRGKDVDSSHTQNTTNTFFHTKTDKGTYTATFTAHTANATDGDLVMFEIVRRGGGGDPTGGDQTLSNLKLERVHTELDELDSFENIELSVIDGGTLLPDTYRVSDSKITIPETSNNVYVGLPYTSTLAPLYLNTDSSVGLKKSASHAVIRFQDTKEAKVGQKENSLEAVKFGSSTTLNTEDAEVWLENANEFLQTIYVVQDAPTPCTVLAMVVDVEGA